MFQLTVHFVRKQEADNPRNNRTDLAQLLGTPDTAQQPEGLYE